MEQRDRPRQSIVRPWELSPVKPIHRPIMPMPPPLLPPTDAEDDGKKSPITLQAQSNNDSGYASPETAAAAGTTRSSPSPSIRRRFNSLPPELTERMDAWYEQHFDHPYPTPELVSEFAECGGVTRQQVQKWFANKRVRTTNTLSFNGAVHPRRLRSLAAKRHFARQWSTPSSSVDVLSSWYDANRHAPVPSPTDLLRLSSATGQHPDYISKWLAMRRFRDATR